jgi:hypothetical protein
VHRAAASRIAVAGASATAMFALVAGMGRASTGNAPAVADAAATGVAAPAAVPPVVVYRRLHVPGATVADPAAGSPAVAGSGAVLAAPSTGVPARTAPVTRSSAS